MFNPSARSDEHWSSCCTPSLIRLYLDNLGSKCNQAALCLFVKELALFRCGRELIEIISSFFSLLPKFGYSLNHDHCFSCCTLSLIRLYRDNIGSQCNRAALCLFVKELALFRCGRHFLKVNSSFFSPLSKFGFCFCSL